MVVLVYLFIISLHIRKGSSLFQSLTPPPSISRSDATYDWCDCNTGNNVTIWPINNKTEAVNVSSGAPVWIHFEQPTSKIAWSCHGMTTNQQSSLNVSLNIWSVQLLPQKKGFGCEKTSGRLHFVNWKHSKGQSVVYSSGENGYACIKIPVLLRSISGRLLAFAEARMITCSDFAWTDLVLKTSDDNGKTWSSLQVVRSESNAKSVPTVIGNAAPVQLQLHGGRRILVPHTRNNSDVWTIFSDDDGNSWSKPTLIGKNVTRSDWKWVGTGPPGSLQLKNGRIIVPSYHSKVRGNLINNIVHGHVMLSDDNGITWRLGQQENGFGNGNHFVNENQAVELLNGSILINGRSFATFTKPRRLQTMSHDGGETFGNVTFVHHLKQPFNGCQGSIVGPLVEINDTVGSLYFTGPDSILKRDHLTLFVSKDSGQTWNKLLLVDSGASGYSSLQIISRNSSTIGNRFDHINHSTLGLLYEQSDVDALIMAPDSNKIMENEIKEAKTASRIKQLMVKYESKLLNSSTTNMPSEQRSELLNGREFLQDKLSGIIAKTFLEKAAAISELSVFIYDNLKDTTNNGKTDESTTVALSKSNMYAQLDIFRSVARRWNEITLDITTTHHSMHDTKDAKDSDDDSDNDSDEFSDNDFDDDDCTMYTDHWTMSFAFDKEDGNAQIKSFEFDPTSSDSERVQRLLTKYVDEKDWRKFEEEIGMLVVANRNIGEIGELNRSGNNNDLEFTKSEFEHYCQHKASCEIIERSTMDEALYLHKKTNNGTIDSTLMFKNVMMQQSPLHNVPIIQCSYENHVKYYLRRPRQESSKVYLVPPVVINKNNAASGDINFNYPGDRNALWSACYASYTSYRTKHDKLTMDTHNGDTSFSLGSSQFFSNNAYNSTSTTNTNNASSSTQNTTNSANGTSNIHIHSNTSSSSVTTDAVDGNVSIEPTMYDMHVLCQKMLSSGSEVIVLPVSSGSAHHHRMIFDCEEDEGLQLLATSSANFHPKSTDNDERVRKSELNKNRGAVNDYLKKQYLAVDSSELLQRWYQQNVQLTTSSAKEMTCESLITLAHVQHILGVCAQSISLKNGLCPYYIMNDDHNSNSIDKTSTENIHKLDIQNIICVVWRVSTIAFNSFIFSAERMTNTNRNKNENETNETSHSMNYSVNVTIEGNAVSYVNTEDEKSKEQISNVPLPVMLSRYVNTWNIDSSKKGTTSKRTGSVLKSPSKKSKRAK